MKLQLPATSAVPAVPALVVAAAAAALALLLVPNGGAPAPSARVAPALELVAGDLAAVVERPVHKVAKAQPGPVPAHTGAHTAALGATPAKRGSVLFRSRNAPVQRVVHHARPPRSRSPQGAALPQVKAPASPAPQVLAQPLGHGHGKGKALGHLKKEKARGHGPKTAPPATKPQVAVPHGPPAVPPGHLENDPRGAGHGPSNGRGGGR